VETGLSLGRIMGPHYTLHPDFKSSPIGAFKRHRSNKVRPIHDLSWPPEFSTNSGIDTTQYSVSYTTVDNIVRFGLMYDEPWASKIDLKNAYMSCKVRPEDRHLLGFSWQRPYHNSEFFSHASLPFGLSSACCLFDQIAESLESVMIHRGAPPTTDHYLDDYISISGSQLAAGTTYDIMSSTAVEAGFEVHDTEPKSIRAARVFECLGIIVDFNLKQLRISEDRICEIRELLADWSQKVCVTKREILSIIGKLQFCSKVVRDGPKFIRRLIELSKRPKLLYHKVKISEQARADLAWWDMCLESHNGICAFPKPWSIEATTIVFTDASDIAVGIVCGRAWSIFEFTGKHLWMTKKSIAWRELFAVVLLLCTFGSSLQNQSVTMFVDNMSMVQCINAGRSKDPAIMGLIRALYYYTSIYHINYKSVHLYSTDNGSADALSRLQFSRFMSLNPLADKHITPPLECIIDF